MLAMLTRQFKAAGFIESECLKGIRILEYADIGPIPILLSTNIGVPGPHMKSNRVNKNAALIPRNKSEIRVVSIR